MHLSPISSPDRSKFAVFPPTQKQLRKKAWENFFDVVKIQLAEEGGKMMRELPVNSRDVRLRVRA
jgi:hypothetical protein